MRRFFLLCFTCMISFSALLAQQTISGRVIEADTGDPLPGVTVLVKGTTYGVYSDESGRYTIQTAPDANTLVFSFIGKADLEVPIDGRAQIDVSLSPEETNLQEVVIVAYGTTRREDVTGSLSSVDGEVLQEVPVAGIDQVLQGRAAGVHVTSANGQPGGGVSVRVRGPSSINSSNQPLYVIDGIPVESQDLQIPGEFGTATGGGLGGQTGNSLSTINFADVESIEVLKDASATALYGSRAANGVVLITTKRGAFGQKPQFDMNFSIGQREPLALPDLLNPQQFRQMVNEARTNVGLDAFEEDFYGNANTDWLDAIFRDATVQRWNFSLKGGSQASRYFASFSIDDQEGTLDGTGFQRLSGRLNLDSRISDKLTFGTSATVSLTTENVQANDNFIIGPYVVALRARPDVPIRQEDGSFTSIAGVADNPVAAAEGYRNDFHTLRILASTYGELEIIPDLRLRSSIALDLTSLKQEQIWSSITLGGRLNGDGYAQRGNNEFRSIIWENTLSYDFELNDQNRFSALIGGSFQRDERSNFIASATDFPNDLLTTFASAATPLSVGGIGAERALISSFARVNYNFDDRYLITATIRGDGSSRFGENNRWGFFPSAAVAWRLDNEAFLENSPILSELKFRASWGIIGNDRIGRTNGGLGDNFASLGLFGSTDVNGSAFSYAGSGGIAPTQIANPELKWETTTQYDVGIDFGFWDFRVTGSVDFYLKDTEDILLQAPVPRNSGFNSVNQNIGEMRNTGVDVTLAVDIIRTDDFTWNLGGNLNYNDNEVRKLVNGEDIEASGFNQSIIREGEPLGSFFGLQVEGIFQSPEEITALNSAAPGGVYQTNGTAPGDFQYRDVNGDGVITNDDRVILGSALYDFMGGINNTLSYKGITLFAFFQFVQGNEIYNFTKRDHLFQRNLFNSFTDILDRWTPSNTDTDLPRVAWGDPNQNRQNSSFFVEDGSFIRLKQVKLSYNFPQALFQNTFLQRGSIFLVGTDLWTLTDYSGIDPEVNTFGGNVSTAQGVDNKTYPGNKTYSVGINLGF